MVRQFYLLNELGQTYSLMDFENNCFLTDPNGLGYDYSRSYEKVGNTYVNYSDILNQNNITGVCNFKKYDNYKNLIDFIEESTDLKLIYKIPSKENKLIEYRRDIVLKSISKSEKQSANILSCDISFDSLSLWYTEQIYYYKIQSESNTIRWKYTWSSEWLNYNYRKIEFYNTGHTEAPFKLEIKGIVENPVIRITDNKGNELHSISIPILIDSNEKLIYCSADNNIMIAKENADGSIESLFKQEYIDITNDNIFKLPIGMSNIVVMAEDDVEDATLTIYPFYKSV